MTDVEIRIAEPADGPALIAAIEQIDRETEFLGMAGERLPWAEQPAAHLDALQRNGTGVYLIAVAGGTIVGYVGALIGHYRSTRGVLSIPHIGVRRTHRQHGVATRLLAAIEDWARTRGAHRLDLSVDEDNAAARALYRACGYDAEGRVAEAAFDRGGWRSYVAMAKVLDDKSRPLAPIVLERQARADSVTVRFRPILESDASALRDWEIALLSTPPRLLKAVDEVDGAERFREGLVAIVASPLHFLVVAVSDIEGVESIVGLLAMAVKSGERLRHDISIIVNVLRDYRTLGVGRRLFEIGEDWAGSRKAHRLSSAVHAANDAGLRFAAAMGFTPEAVMRRYARFDALHVDLVGLVKFLPES